MSLGYALPAARDTWTLEDIRKSATVLIKSLGTLSSPLRLRSPRLVAGLLSRAAISISTQRKIAGLFKDPVLYEAAESNPRLPFKHLTCRYLMRDFPISTCAECFFHHYHFLQSILPVWLLRQTLLQKVTLMEINQNGIRFAITMNLSTPFDTEGELSLNLEMEEKIVYVISFSIVPGRVVQADAKDIFLITRIQGAKGLQDLSQATKALGDVSPAVLLFAALHGIGSAFGINTMASINGARHLSYQEEYAGSFQRSYDDFFTQRGIQRNLDGYFVSPLPLAEKPLSNIKKGHKIRTREKRALRRDVYLACVNFFVRNGLPAPAIEAQSSVEPDTVMSLSSVS